MDSFASLSQVLKEQKHDIPTSTNVAYGCVGGARYTECAIYDMPSGVTMATQVHVYETVPN